MTRHGTAAGRSLARVLVLLPSMALGGVEVHAAAFCRVLAEAGVAVAVALEPALRTGFARLLGPGHPARLLDAAVGLDPATLDAGKLERQEAAVAPLLAAWRPDLVVLPLPWPTAGLGLMLGLEAVGQRSLVVAHLAGLDPERPLPDAMRARIGAAPFGWAAVSRPVAARIAGRFGFDAGRIEVVPNGVAIPPDGHVGRAVARVGQRRRLDLPEAAPLVVFAGRLDAAKGADLLPAIATRLDIACGATLAVLGDGRLRAELEESDAAARGGPLRLLGHALDVAEWLLAANLLILPSRQEGCPLIFLEAAARRCPVVASGAALECFGDLAPGLAGLAPDGGLMHLTDLATVRLNDPAASRAAVDAVYRTVVAFDEAAMFRRYFGLLRAALA